ncbi:MAG: DUF6713 family protein [Bacteroidota bacterium]
MTDFIDLVYYLVVSLLLTHELDAVHKHEWRLLFYLRNLEESAARQAFILLHIPLLVLLLWLSTHSQETVRFATVVGIDVFAIIHAGLHARLSGHPAYAFHPTYSKLLIYGAAVFSAIHMALLTFTLYS